MSKSFEQKKGNISVHGSLLGDSPGKIKFNDVNWGHLNDQISNKIQSFNVSPIEKNSEKKIKNSSKIFFLGTSSSVRLQESSSEETQFGLNLFKSGNRSSKDHQVESEISSVNVTQNLIEKLKSRGSFLKKKTSFGKKYLSKNLK